MDEIGSNKLKPNKDSKKIFSILNKAKISESVAMAWRMQAGAKLTAELKFRLIRKFKNEIELIPEENNKAKLDQIIAGNEKINIYLPEQAVLFQSKIIGYGVPKGARYINHTILRLESPQMIAQIDRRKHLRLIVSDNVDVLVQFQKKIENQREQIQGFKKNCLDISAGGVSFIASRTEKKFFQVSDIISKMSFNIENKILFTNGTIVNVIPLEPNEDNKLIYGGFKICIKFVDTNKEFVNYINDFVFRHINFDVTNSK